MVMSRWRRNSHPLLLAPLLTPEAKPPTSLPHRAQTQAFVVLFKHRKPSLRPLHLFLLQGRLILQILAELATSFHSVFQLKYHPLEHFYWQANPKKGTLSPCTNVTLLENLNKHSAKVITFVQLLSFIRTQVPGMWGLSLSILYLSCLEKCLPFGRCSIFVTESPGQRVQSLSYPSEKIL